MPGFRIGQAVERDIAMPVSFGPATGSKQTQMNYLTSISTGIRVDAAIVIEQWATEFGPFTSLWEYGPDYAPEDWDGSFSDRQD